METLENIPAESRITVLKSTIKVQEKIIQALEERIELLKKNHKLEIKNYYIKKITMKTVDQLEDALCPQRNKLIPCEDGYKATILDIELDPIECSFYSDDCVHIDTKDYTYITLDLNNLYKLIDLIEEEITLREEL